MEENRIPKRVLYMNFGTTRLRGRPRNRWQDEVREDGRIVGGEGWQEKLCNREEWKMLLRKARNHRILHVPMEWMNIIIKHMMSVSFHYFIQYLHWKIFLLESNLFLSVFLLLSSIQLFKGWTGVAPCHSTHNPTKHTASSLLVCVQSLFKTVLWINIC